MSYPHLGKMLVLLGAAIALAGLVVWTGVGSSWWGRLGRLPGDIHYRRGGTQVYFPWVTCLLISALVTLISWLCRGRR